MIDLHSHSDASDGQYAPAELVALAARAGVAVLGLTDHDTVAGLGAAAEAAARLGLRLVPGIEVSVALNRREVHLLGHFVDPAEGHLTAWSLRLEAERAGRMEAMLERLARAGIKVALEEVRAISGAAPLGRPHLARALVDRGVCVSTREAFDRFLADGKLCHVPRREVSPAEAIALLHGAGGTVTLAHPGASKVHRGELELLARCGLDGLEVGHADHPPSQREAFERWAAPLGLVATAGSDFHGPQVTPDRSLGEVSMSEAALEALEARRP
jgi:3',5'-nucleoside bisphosphate phosphatase